MEKVYPQQVLDKTQELIKDLQEQNFFEQEGCSIQSAERVLNEFFLGNFLAGETLAFDSEEQINQVLQNIILDSTLESLHSKGLIDFFEDEAGEIFPIITKEGEEALGDKKE